MDHGKQMEEYPDPRREEGKGTGAKPEEASDPEATHKSEKFQGSTIRQ